MGRTRSTIAALAVIAATTWPAAGARAAESRTPATAAAAHQTVPEDTKPGTGTSAEPLGDKLDRSNGVIRPPAGVDPGLTHSPAPSGDTMPVIPPPGTAGGQPDVNPK